MRIFSPTQDGRVTFEDLRGLRSEGYIRDSTLDQRDGYGPELQRRAIQNFAKSYGLVLGNAWYTDFITGTSTLKRSGFHQAFNDAETDRFDVLLVYNTSRFARNRADAIRYKTQMQNLGKVVVFVSQSIISGNDNDFLNEGISEVLDEHYSRNLSRWVRDGLRVKASQGHSLGTPPLGYQHAIRSEGRWVSMIPNDSSMPTLLALLKGYATGKHSFRTLAQTLNAKGYRTTKGKPFTESSISTTLNNPFYIDKIVYHRNRLDEEVIEGNHVVPEQVGALWQRCQQIRRAKISAGEPSPTGRKHNVYSLTGILRCDQCGEPLHGVTNRQKGEGYRRMLHSFRSCAMRPLSLSAARIEDEFAEECSHT